MENLHKLITQLESEIAQHEIVNLQASTGSVGRHIRTQFENY